MKKTIGAILLIAGTCMGSGMIALPIVLANLGVIPSIVFMLVIWFVMYYTSLINVELNLQAGKGLSLGALGRLFSGKKAEWLGIFSLKLLSYSLLAVFIYGGSSVLQKLMASQMGWSYTFSSIAMGFTLCITIILLLPIQWIDYVNRILFVGLLGIIAVLLFGLTLKLHWSKLPLFSQNFSTLSSWTTLIPVVFTSFGFQVIFHTLTDYCKKDPKILKKAFFWGSLIPAISYILLTTVILGVLYHTEPQFYSKMAGGNVEVGELIEKLSGVGKWGSCEDLICWISFLAIVTSVLGVGVGLCDSLKAMMARRIAHDKLRTFVSSVTTVAPAYLIVIFVPNAFIAVLGFAGMILAVIAILLPIYLLWQTKAKAFFYPELQKRWLIGFSFLVAIFVIASELLNMLGRLK